MSQVFILKHAFGEEDCAVLRFPEGLPAIHKPAKGLPYRGDYAEGTRFYMDADVPGKNIPDIVSNVLGLFMVSKRLKAILESHCGPDIEFLRFELVNHKRKVAASDLYLANVLGSVDCVDMGKTLGSRSALDDHQFRKIRRLVLDEERIPEGKPVFRLRANPALIAVSGSVRSDMENAGISGAEFVSPGQDIVLP